MFSDLRFVVRALVRNRSFTLVTILTLALGIGSAAAIFNVTDWVLFRANQYPSDVYLIGGHSPDQPFMPIRFPFMVRAYEQQTGALSEIGKAAMMPGNVVLNGAAADVFGKRSGRPVLPARTQSGVSDGDLLGLGRSGWVFVRHRLFERVESHARAHAWAEA